MVQVVPVLTMIMHGSDGDDDNDDGNGNSGGGW